MKIRYTGALSSVEVAGCLLERDGDAVEVDEATGEALLKDRPDEFSREGAAKKVSKKKQPDPED